MALFFGWDPKDKQFFVATKSIFNKSPVLIKTVADVNAYPVAAIQPQLLAALKHLRMIAPTNTKTVWQGDLLYTKDMLSVKDDQVVFTPNTITYAVDIRSNLGSFIHGSSLGIVIHTSYPSLDKMSAPTYNPSLKDFKPSHYVWFSNAEIPSSGLIHLDSDDAGVIEDLINSAERQVKSVSPKLYSILGTAQISGTIIKGINGLIRSGGYLHMASSDELRDKLVEYLRQALGGSKLGMQRVFQITVTYQDDFAKLIRAYNAITAAKTMLVKALEKNEHEIKSLYSKPEGFVAIQKGSTVKLVNRHEFSRANFARHGGTQ